MVQVGSAAPRCSCGLPPLAGAGWKSLWHYPKYPKRTVTSAQRCHSRSLPSILPEERPGSPARDRSRVTSSSCRLGDGREAGCAAPLGPGKVPRRAHTFPASFALHWPVCLISPVSHFPALPNRLQQQRVCNHLYHIVPFHKILVIQNQRNAHEQINNF